MKLQRLLFAALLLLSQGVFADNMLMVRVAEKANITFDTLLTSLQEHGYSIAHVQTCDRGMTGMGYKTDFYKTMFFAKGPEVRKILKAHPEFAPYLPLKVAVVASRDETVITMVDPRVFAAHYPNDPQMLLQFERWYSDIISMLSELRRLSDPVIAARLK